MTTVLDTSQESLIHTKIADAIVKVRDALSLGAHDTCVGIFDDGGFRKIASETVFDEDVESIVPRYVLTKAIYMARSLNGGINVEKEYAEFGRYYDEATEAFNDLVGDENVRGDLVVSVTIQQDLA